MKYLMILLFFPLITYSQSYNGFKWDNEVVTFKTVQMNTYYSDTHINIFNGFKDASVTINNATSVNPNAATVSVKLSGYFEMENASISSFEYKVKDYQSTINYTVSNTIDLLIFTITYDEVTGKPTRIFAFVTKNYLDKKARSIVFILTGFE